MSSYLKFRDWLEIEARTGSSAAPTVAPRNATGLPDAVGFLLRRRGAAEPQAAPRRTLMLEQLPKIVALGVQCFKISGRDAQPR